MRQNFLKQKTAKSHEFESLPNFILNLLHFLGLNYKINNLNKHDGKAII